MDLQAVILEALQEYKLKAESGTSAKASGLFHNDIHCQ